VEGYINHIALELVLLTVCDSGGWVVRSSTSEMADESALLHPTAQTIHGSIPGGAAESQLTATHVEVGR
jgi:hypothetical protein